MSFSFHDDPELDAPRILVLMATFNGAPWLGEQVDSILSQQGVSIRLVVSDDGSSDDTPKLVDQWARQDPRVRRLATGESRLGATGNFLRLLHDVDFADAEFVALSDQDDVWEADRLKRAATALRSSGAGGYSSDVQAFWPDGRSHALGKACLPARFDFLFEPAGPGCTYVLSLALAQALKRRLTGSLDRFRGLGYHDWFIYAFARTRALPWIIDPRPSVRYRQHRGNDTGANRGWKAAHKRLKRLREGWYRSQILLVASLCRGSDGEGASLAVEPVTQRLQRLNAGDRIWLAMHVRWFRRNPRDRLALAALLVLGVMR